MAKDLHLDIVKYHFDSAKDNVPVNAAIAKANSMMHDMEIDILGQMVNSGTVWLLFEIWNRQKKGCSPLQSMQKMRSQRFWSH